MNLTKLWNLTQGKEVSEQRDTDLRLQKTENKTEKSETGGQKQWKKAPKV